MSSSSANLRYSHLGFLKTLDRITPIRTRNNIHNIKLSGFQFQRHECNLRSNLAPIKAADESSDGFSPYDDWEYGESDGIIGGDSYINSSGDESDAEVVVNFLGDVDLPSTNERFESSDGALAVTAHRFSMLRRRGKTNKIQRGYIINMGLIAFLAAVLLFVDWCSWRIVRLPLAPFYLSRPFMISAVLAAISGYFCVLVLQKLKIYQKIRREGPHVHTLKKGTPTMGGLFFIPVGVTVAGHFTGFSSLAVLAAGAATLAFAAIGLLDDVFSIINNHNCGLPAWLKIMLEVLVGLWFSFWLESANMSSPYSMYSFL